MKNIKIYFLLLFFAAFTFQACEDDEITPFIEGLEVEDSDLIQVTDANPNVTVSFAAKGSDLNSITVSLVPEGSTSEVYTNTLRNITSDNLNRVKLSVPFPTPDIAPSGKYTLSFAIDGASGETSTNSFVVNVLNNQTIKYDCEFPEAPAGKVTVFLTVPVGDKVDAAEKDLYITGNFETDLGGSDWSGGGNSSFKFTRVSAHCYYVTLDQLPAGKLFKITMGTWDQERLTETGGTPDNTVSTGANMSLTAYNFKTLELAQYPETLPTAAIKTGHNTFIINVEKDVDAAAKYYLVSPTATNLDGAIEAFAVVGAKKIAVAVPKGSEGTQYKVVKDNIDNVAALSANPFGFNPEPYTLIIPEATSNPLTVEQGFVGFAEDLQKDYSTFLLVGGATPAGWENSAANTQLFTKVSDTIFEIVINLTGNGEYLIIATIGDWSDNSKIAKHSGTPESGTLGFGGANFVAPASTGTYKITMDIEAATYTVTPQ
jgi:hypothetical protein